jgi:antitoxin (DNA-binding transcriptional repressor) of toxin-antitoxin stability system
MQRVNDRPAVTARFQRVEFEREIGHHLRMTATVEQTQRDLSGMIRLAIAGEEILITQAGAPVAKLTGLPSPGPGMDREKWLESLRKLRQSTSKSAGRSSDEILNDDRAGRD